MVKTRTGIIAVAAIATLALGACGGGSSAATDPTTAATSASSAAPEAGTAVSGTVEIADNNGIHTIAVPPQSVVALDNRSFETLYEWGIELSAATRTLMPPTVGYVDDESIPDIGNHREPNLELIVAAGPDLVINGQRLLEMFDEIGALVPNATQILLDPREGEPFDEELSRQVTVLGQVFGKESEAAEIVADFDASIAAVKESYNPELTVMAVNVSGGEVGYLAPTVGRTLGPVFDIFGFTPALEIAGAT
nr:ABC transporter substrate-binding protein [Actinomycetales bacterium]